MAASRDWGHPGGAISDGGIGRVAYPPSASSVDGGGGRRSPGAPDTFIRAVLSPLGSHRMGSSLADVRPTRDIDLVEVELERRGRADDSIILPRVAPCVPSPSATGRGLAAKMPTATALVRLVAVPDQPSSCERY